MRKFSKMLALLMMTVVLVGCKQDDKEDPSNKDIPNITDEIHRVQSGTKAYEVVKNSGDIESVCEEKYVEQVKNVIETMSDIESDNCEVIYVYNDYGVSRLQLNEQGIICGVIEYGTVY